MTWSYIEEPLTQLSLLDQLMTMHAFSTKKVEESIKMEIISDGPCIEPSGNSFILRRNRFVTETIDISESAIELIRLYGFKSDSGVTYNIVILRGSEFPPNWCSEKKIREEAHHRGLISPPQELSFLICKRIDVWMMKKHKLKTIIIMHAPLRDRRNDRSLYALDFMEDEKKLNVFGSDPENLWFENDGFAFLEPLPIV